jgi:hypothetical protein
MITLSIGVETTPPTKMKTTTPRIVFVTWDHRPAILVDGKAFAILKPNGLWEPADRSDVWSTAGVLSETAWRNRFAGKLGSLHLRHGQDNLPQLKKPPTAKEFDDAARAVFHHCREL